MRPVCFVRFVDLWIGIVSRAQIPLCGGAESNIITGVRMHRSSCMCQNKSERTGGWVVMWSRRCEWRNLLCWLFIGVDVWLFGQSNCKYTTTSWQSENMFGSSFRSYCWFKVLLMCTEIFFAKFPPSCACTGKVFAKLIIDGTQAEKLILLDGAYNLLRHIKVIFSNQFRVSISMKLFAGNTST